MPIFMKYGDDIKGDAKSAGHEQWIAISSFSWGVGRGIGDPSAAEADREGSTPSVSEIVVTKDNDNASTGMMRASLGLKPAGEGQTVQIDFCKTDTDKPEVYLSFTLTNTLISGWSMSSGGDRPSESVSLNFTQVQLTNTAMDATDAAGGQDIASYDLSAQTGS